MADTPRFRYAASGAITVRQAVLSGQGVRATCVNCWAISRRTAEELLDRFWRHMDVRLADIMARTACPACGSKHLTLETERGATPFPVPDHMSWEVGRAIAERDRQVEAWLAERAAETPKAPATREGDRGS